MGSDALTSGSYADASGPLGEALSREHHVEHLPAHLVASSVPSGTVALARYEVVILSDIGARSFMEGSPADGIDRLALLAGLPAGSAPDPALPQVLDRSDYFCLCSVDTHKQTYPVSTRASLSCGPRERQGLPKAETCRPMRAAGGLPNNVPQSCAAPPPPTKKASQRL